MATEEGAPKGPPEQTSAPTPTPTSTPAVTKESPAQPKSQKGQGKPAESTGEKKLSNAELKKKQKEEKAARRAAAKTTTGGPPQGGPGGATQQAGSQDGRGGGKAKQGKQDASQSQNQQRGGLAVKQPTIPLPPKEAKPKVPECFSHLSMAKRVPMTQADKDVHPAVLILGQHMSTFAISDSITRLEATLLAFKKVISSYTTPHGNTLSRHFTSHVLNPQIEYLTACRPMCFSMGNAIRWLKLQISKIDIDMPDAEAKKQLCESIDNYVRERIALADVVIVKAAANSIQDEEVILTYAHHHLVERAFIQAKKEGKSFSVIIVDDPFDRVGTQHAKNLSAVGIPVRYASDLGALRIHLRETSRVLVAAEAFFSNGAMYARAGTSDVAILASDMDIPVIGLCETINFTDRVSIDSLTYNEIDPERNTEEAFRLLFDTTKDKYISTVVTELGSTSAMSEPAILRKLEEL